MPQHIHYVEPYAGGLSVLLAKPPSWVSEVVNDVDKDLTNFWKVLQGRRTFEDFKHLCWATPFSEAEWNDADLEFKEWPVPDPKASDRVVRAWRFFIHCRMSLAGRRKSFAPLSKTRVRRGMNEQASAWLSAIDGLAEVHARLRLVAVRCADALDVIQQEDTKGTLYYLDPPYLQETRAAPDVYRHECDRKHHEELLTLVREVQGKVMLSGYDSPLYAERLEGWTKHTFDLPNNAAGGDSKRRMEECLWCNF